MARLPRVIAVNGPHHVTQRGNGRRFVLDGDTDPGVYLDLLKQSLALHGVAIMGYCLMSNHAHLVLVPDRAESLGLALKHAHGRYASYWNAIHHSSGHVWQGRYYSCPLDEAHVWEALRYTELNPVRAGLVAESASWLWSSAAVHCAAEPDSGWLALELWQSRWNSDSWRAFLEVKESESALAAIRTSTHTGRPLGTAEFVHALELSTRRLLAPQKRGRRPTAIADPRQSVLSLDA
jgi:putative transposase